MILRSSKSCSDPTWFHIPAVLNDRGCLSDTLALRLQGMVVLSQWGVLHCLFLHCRSYLSLMAALWKLAALQLQTGNDVTSFFKQPVSAPLGDGKQFLLSEDDNVLWTSVWNFKVTFFNHLPIFNYHHRMKSITSRKPKKNSI